MGLLLDEIFSDPEIHEIVRQLDHARKSE